MATVASYSAHVESNQEIKKQIKKEWADEEAEHKHGGRRRWRVWFVQLICELLVCVTAPLAIGLSIKIMYETAARGRTIGELHSSVSSGYGDWERL